MPLIFSFRLLLAESEAFLPFIRSFRPLLDGIKGTFAFASLLLIPPASSWRIQRHFCLSFLHSANFPRRWWDFFLCFNPDRAFSAQLAGFPPLLRYGLTKFSRRIGVLGFTTHIKQGIPFRISQRNPGYLVFVQHNYRSAASRAKRGRRLLWYSFCQAACS